MKPHPANPTFLAMMNFTILLNVLIISIIYLKKIKAMSVKLLWHIYGIGSNCQPQNGEKYLKYFDEIKI